MSAYRSVSGKIASLPPAIREQINRRLQAGDTQASIIEWANAQPEVVATLAEKFEGEPISPKNMCLWTARNFREWETTIARGAQIRARSEMALEMVRELARDGTTTITEANQTLVAAAINEVLVDYDPADLKRLVAEDPAQFLALARTASTQASVAAKLRETELKFSRYQDEVTARKREMEASLRNASANGGITPETLEAIQRQLNLL